MASKTNPEAVTVDLLRKICAEHKEAPLSRAELYVYLCLLIEAHTRGYGTIRSASELTKVTGLHEVTVRRALNELADRGLLIMDCLIPDKKTVHERAIEYFPVMTREEAKDNGFVSVTYGYKDNERHLFNALLVQNLGQPVVVVEYERKTGRIMELWRHKDNLHRYNQNDEVALGAGIKLGKMS